MAMSVLTYVSNTHAPVRFEYFVIEIQVLRNARLSSLDNRCSGISNVQSSYVNVRRCACVRADCKEKYMAKQQLLEIVIP